MDSNQVAFIEGFVKQCAARGWTEDQTSRALALVQLNEQFQDPDFATGFAKQAETLKSLLGAAGRWATDTGKPMNQAILGAGIGGLGGLLFGGKNRIRNTLLGAAGGGLAGYGIGRGVGALTRNAPPGISRGEAFGEAGTKNLPDMTNAGNGAPKSSPAAVSPEVAKANSEERGRLRATMTDTSAPVAARIQAQERLRKLQGVEEGPGVVSTAASGALDGLKNLQKAVAAPAVAAAEGYANLQAGAERTKSIFEQKGRDATAQKLKEELESILVSGAARNWLGISTDPVQRAKAIMEEMEKYKQDSIQSGNRPAVNLR